MEPDETSTSWTRGAGSGNTPQRADCFATTHWTAVVAAGGADSQEAGRALEELCRAYWYPLYAYIRRQGRTREDAEDLTQGFFERFLDGNPFAGVSAERGRFRAFLLASLKHFLANEADRAGQRVAQRGDRIGDEGQSEDEVALEQRTSDVQSGERPADPILRVKIEQADEGAHHEDLAVREVDELQDPVDHRIAERDERDHRPLGDAREQGATEVVEHPGSPVPRPCGE